MTSKPIRIITGLIGTAMLMTFVIGLAWSISTGFAGFWGGLPFWVISVTVLGMLIYDFWDDCVRRRSGRG